MKHHFIAIVATVCTVAQMQAQCGSCSTTISNANPANQLVQNGQTLCITPTGTVSGLITVLAGGKLCNQGLINSTNVWIAGGELQNSGTIRVNNLTVSSAGSFTNNISFRADSFLVIGNNSRYYNLGTQVNLAFATADHATSINESDITSNVIYDSIGDFTNNGNIIVNDGLANGWGSTCINNGNIRIVNDFANGYNSIFINNKNMSVARDFFNGNNSSYTTKCMVTVGRNWANSSTILGPNSSCGGFNIAGVSSNSGNIGSATSFIDLCDAGHPSGGIDVNAGGTIAPTTTYCTCTNHCVTVGVKEQAPPPVSSLLIYPNPAADRLVLSYICANSAVLGITVRDMMGRTVLSGKQESYAGNNELGLDTGSLAEGTYILSIQGGNSGVATKMFSIAR